MANLIETPTFEAGIYQFETTDPVQGGPGGVDNLPHRQLANRTQALKTTQDAEVLRLTGHIGSGGASHAAATTVSAGFLSASDKVKINNSVSLAQLAAVIPTAVLDDNGYIKIPITGGGEFIFQWYSAYFPGGTVTSVAFPIAFPTAALAVWGSKGAHGLQFGATHYGIDASSNTHWRIQNLGAPESQDYIYIFAIGL
jgi:hypothetical protein